MSIRNLLTQWRSKSDSKSQSTLSSNSGCTTEDTKPDVINIIGGYGPWQRNLFVLLFLASIPSTWHNLMMTFMAPPGVDFWCARTANHTNMSVHKWRNLTATSDGWDRCKITQFWLNDSSKSSPVKCSRWEYNKTFYTSTVIDEWNLVCDREWLISLSKSIYNIGYLIAVFVFGQLSDSLGRRPTLLVSYIVNISAGMLSAVSTSYTMFVILRFFTAVGAAGFYTISFVLIVEVVSPCYRSMVGIAINFGWCLAFMSLPAVAWLVRDWTWLQLAVTIPKLLFLPIFWMLLESPRWLLIKRRTAEFRKVVLKAATQNGRNEEWVNKEIEKLLLTNGKVVEEKKATILDLFRTPGLWIHAVNLFYNWLVNSFIYFGLSYNTEDLAGDVYLNFFISGAVEFPAYLGAIYVVGRYGRRIPLAVGMCAGGIACATTIAISSCDHGGLWQLTVALSMIGKFFITATFAIVYVYTAEIFPTVVRNVGVGTGSTVARIGSTLAPFVRELDSATHSIVTNAVFATLSVSSGLLVLLLPETNNMVTTDTLEEAQELGRNKEAERNWPHEITTKSRL